MLLALTLLAVALLVFFELPVALALLTGRRNRLARWTLGLAVLALFGLVALATRSLPATVVALVAGVWVVRPWRRSSTAAGDLVAPRRR